MPCNAVGSLRSETVSDVEFTPVGAVVQQNTRETA